MEPVYGIHLGLVVSGQQDPENRNRVQVWVPHISSTVYTSLNAKVQTPNFKDPAIKGPADLLNIDANLLPTLQAILPWAECAAPFFGGTSGLFNTATGVTANTTGSTITGTTSDPKGFPQTTLNQTLCAIKPLDTKIGDSAQVYNGAQLGFNCNQFTGNSTDTKQSYCDMQWISVADAHVINLKAAQASNIANPEQTANLLDALMSKESTVVNGYVAINERYKEPNGTISEGLFSFTGGVKPDGSTDAFYGINSQNVYNPAAQAAAAIKAIQTNNTNYWNSNNWNYAVNAAQGGPVFVNNPLSSPQNNLNATGIRTIQYTDSASKKGMVPFNIAVAGSAVGTYSTPPPGAKVFVFFMGGDVQKPVYFAQTINPGDMAAITG
jgi:hypothetical protein